MKQLIAELDGLAEDMGRDGATGVNTVASASQQLARLERENAALRIEINRLRVALRDIADASTGQLTLPMWIRGKVAKTLGQEAQP